MKYAALFVASMFAFIPSTFAQDNGSASLYEFLQGHYHVIGRWPDSNQTYTGTVILKMHDGRLKVIRRIGGEEIEATGTIETATADKVTVLRVRFVQHGRRYEATYLIHSDLDNYGRLSGYLYLQGGKTKQTGLEALFIDRRPLETDPTPKQ